MSAASTIVVLGASGGVGRQLVREALARGLRVRALVRDPDRAAFPPHPLLEVVRANVDDADSVKAAIGPSDVLISGLGSTTKAEIGTLTTGARAVIAAKPARIVWVGAFGTGLSAQAISTPVAWLLRKAFGAENDDKVNADQAVLDAGGIVIHTGPMSDKPNEPNVTLEPITQTPHQFFPAGASRATVARLMLDAANQDPFIGSLLAVRRNAQK